jgi:hypothetical protein
VADEPGDGEATSVTGRPHRRRRRRHRGSGPGAGDQGAGPPA